MDEYLVHAEDAVNLFRRPPILILKMFRCDFLGKILWNDIILIGLDFCFGRG